MTLAPLPCVLLAALSCFSIRAQDPATGQQTEEEEAAARLADLEAFVNWMKDYESGAIRFVQDMKVDEDAIAVADGKMAALARWANLDAAKKLFRAATIDPSPPGAKSSADKIEFHAELLPWRVRGMARKHIAAIPDGSVDEWLIKMLYSPNLRDANHPDRPKADAALQILGMRESTEGKVVVLEASMRLPPKLRVRALDVLSSYADRSVVPHFLGLLKDHSPNMRIAALNALGKALGPHTDETAHDKIAKDVVKQRTTTIGAMRKILIKDKTWQVRAAACNSLIQLKSKHVIPALIDGLDAELKRKKDPWAMDVRLHRSLERLTGQSVPLGSSRPWKTFWRKEKGRFKFAKPEDAAKKNAESTEGEKYEKFFSLDLSSDRVLFVLDFSGSMKEPITLKTEVTAAKAGTTLIKAKMVVEEIKKLIMSLPDGAIFNIIVFSDGVRVWRPDGGGRPSPVKLNDNSRDDLLGTFLDSLSPQGPTNLHGALDIAIGLEGRGIDDKGYRNEFDTIYILSDGAPTYGKIRDKKRIRELVRDANRLKQLTIHTVTFGELNDVSFLRDLAEENGGRHIHVE